MYQCDPEKYDTTVLSILGIFLLILGSSLAGSILLVTLPNSEARTPSRLRIRGVRTFVMLNVARTPEGGSDILETVRSFNDESPLAGRNGRSSCTPD